MNNQELFDHMKDQHGLTLLESEMLEIELICIKGIKSQLEKSAAKIYKDLLGGWHVKCDNGITYKTPSNVVLLIKGLQSQLEELIQARDYAVSQLEEVRKENQKLNIQALSLIEQIDSKN